MIIRLPVKGYHFISVAAELVDVDTPFILGLNALAKLNVIVDLVDEKWNEKNNDVNSPIARAETAVHHAERTRTKYRKRTLSSLQVPLSPTIRSINGINDTSRPNNHLFWSLKHFRENTVRLQCVWTLVGSAPHISNLPSTLYIFVQSNGLHGLNECRPKNSTPCGSSR